MSPEVKLPETQEPAAPRSAQPGWRQWLQLVAAAFVLLAVSQALWLWQTWPVRELLQQAPARTTGSR